MGLKSFIVESDQLLTEAFNSKPYDVTMTKKGAGDVFFTFEDEDGTEYRIQFYTSGGLGQNVRRVYVGEKVGNIYKDAIKGFKNPLRVIATMIDSVEKYLMTPLGKTIQGLAVDLSKKATPKGLPLIKKIMKRSQVIKKHLDLLDSDLTVDAGRGVVWTVRKGVNPADAYDGKKVHGMLGDTVPAPEKAPSAADFQKEVGDILLKKPFKEMTGVISGSYRDAFRLVIEKNGVVVASKDGTEVASFTPRGQSAKQFAGMITKDLEGLADRFDAGEWEFGYRRWKNTGKETSSKTAKISAVGSYTGVEVVNKNGYTAVVSNGNEIATFTGVDIIEGKGNISFGKSGVKGSWTGVEVEVGKHAFVQATYKFTAKMEDGRTIELAELEIALPVTPQVEPEVVTVFNTLNAAKAKLEMSAKGNLKPLNIRGNIVKKHFGDVFFEFTDGINNFYVEKIGDKFKAYDLKSGYERAQYYADQAKAIEYGEPEEEVQELGGTMDEDEMEYQDSSIGNFSDSLDDGNAIDNDTVKSMAADEGWKFVNQSSDGTYIMFTKDGNGLNIDLDGDWSYETSDGDIIAGGEWGDMVSLRDIFSKVKGESSSVNVDEAYEQENYSTQVLEFGTPYAPKFKKTSRNILAGFKSDLTTEGAKINITDDSLTMEVRVLADDSGLYYPAANWREYPDTDGISAPRMLEAIIGSLVGKATSGGFNYTRNSRSLNRSGELSRGRTKLAYKSTIERGVDRNATWELVLNLVGNDSIGAGFRDTVKQEAPKTFIVHDFIATDTLGNRDKIHVDLELGNVWATSNSGGGNPHLSNFSNLWLGRDGDSEAVKDAAIKDAANKNAQELNKISNHSITYAGAREAENNKRRIEILKKRGMLK